MSAPGLHGITDADGPAALPRRNGELVFQAPWESRAFGVAIALQDAGAIDYEAFRSRLIAEIAAHEHAHGAGEDGADYYERWLTALEEVLVEQQIVSAEEIRRRAAAIAHERAHDHNHLRDHDHRHR